MADNTVNGLLATARSLEEVVADALVEDNSLAEEQLALAAKYIRHVAERYPHAADRDRVECREYLELAEQILAQGESIHDKSEVSELRERIGEARNLLDEPRTPARDVAQAAGRLRSATARIVRESDSPELERLALDTGHRIVRLMRTWFLPLGWESGDDLQPIEETVRSDQKTTA